MTVLSTSTLLVLTILVKNSFIVFHNPKVTEAFVCFNKENDTWPDEWRRLHPMIQDNIPILQTVNIPQNNCTVFQYKIRLVYANRTFQDTQWKQILKDNLDNVCNLTSVNTILENSFAETIPISVAICTSFLIILIIYIFRNKLISVYKVLLGN